MVEVVPPTERRCERCGRKDVWDDEAVNWTIVTDGDPHCLHEWDINGTYNPIREDTTDASAD